MQLEDQSHDQFRDSLLNLSHYVLARSTSLAEYYALLPLSMSAEKLGTLVSTIEKNTDSDIFIPSHVYIMNYIQGSMWNLALGVWEDDAAIAGQLGEALSRCIVGPDSSEIVESLHYPASPTVLRENIPSET